MRRLKVMLVLLVFGVSSLISGVGSTKAFADDRDRHDRGQQRGWGQREHVQYGGHRYDYHEGRFYAQSLFGFILDLVLPPRGIVVTYLPSGYRTIVVGRTTYYQYEDVYYQPTSGGYMVVDPPVVVNQYAPAPVVYTPEVPYEGGTVVVNVPTERGGMVAITLVRRPDGFTGPQGEFYSTFPSTDELRVRYGR